MQPTRSLQDDAELVREVLSGRRDAFGLLYDRYAPLVRAVAWDATHDQAAVLDLTQETFLRAYRQLVTLRDRDRFGPWLVGITRQVVREAWRRRKHQPLGETDIPSAAGDSSGIDDRDELARVLELVRRLPETERLAIHAFYLHEQNIATTAKLLNISRSGAYDVLKRACSQLARWLASPGVTNEVPP
jgi:RNA polymerase sigma-70 factor, ECF subfamily